MTVVCGDKRCDKARTGGGWGDNGMVLLTNEVKRGAHNHIEAIEKKQNKSGKLMRWCKSKKGGGKRLTQCLTNTEEGTQYLYSVSPEPFAYPTHQWDSACELRRQCVYPL